MRGARESHGTIPLKGIFTYTYNSFRDGGQLETYPSLPPVRGFS
jgi:hypothetical protein